VGEEKRVAACDSEESEGSEEEEEGCMYRSKAAVELWGDGTMCCPEVWLERWPREVARGDCRKRPVELGCCKCEGMACCMAGAVF